MALAHNDAFLPLDEINQVKPDAASHGAYMLANGQGKSRANRTGALRPNYEWRVIFLSTGEISLASKMAEDGKRSTAGQEVRVIDIPADAGQGMGLFEELHGFSRPDLFADALRDATQRHYGHAARALIAEIVKDAAGGITAEIREFIAEAASKICPERADGQVRRVARRFALTACAGELAISYGILPWPAGTACQAAKRCFNDWLQSSGGAGQKEENDAVEAVFDFIAQQASRFCLWDAPNAPIHNRAGFYRDKDGARTFYVFKEVFQREICSERGVDHETAAKVLANRGLLKKSPDGKRTRKERLPGGLGNQRVYVITTEGGE
jgi:putative DNA primase/helicase